MFQLFFQIYVHWNIFFKLYFHSLLICMFCWTNSQNTKQPTFCIRNALSIPISLTKAPCFINFMAFSQTCQVLSPSRQKSQPKFSRSHANSSKSENKSTGEYLSEIYELAIKVSAKQEEWNNQTCKRSLKTNNETKDNKFITKLRQDLICWR